MPKDSKHIVLGVCGSIAAYKAGDIVRRLQESGCEVTVVMTDEARQFVSPVTFAGLSGKQVYSEMFDASSHAGRMIHIDLAREADAVLIAPATANMIAKLAHGMADDLLSTLILTTRAPVLIAPAMNDEMYAHGLVQENCAKLKKCGVKFIEPVKGKLACGVVGVGHLADVEEVVKEVVGIL